MNEKKRYNHTKRTKPATRKPRIKQFNKNGILMDNARPPKQFRKPDRDE